MKTETLIRLAERECREFAAIETDATMARALLRDRNTPEDYRWLARQIRQHRMDERAYRKLRVTLIRAANRIDRQPSVAPSPAEARAPQ